MHALRSAFEDPFDLKCYWRSDFDRHGHIDDTEGAACPGKKRQFEFASANNAAPPHASRSGFFTRWPLHENQSCRGRVAGFQGKVPIDPQMETITLQQLDDSLSSGRFVGALDIRLRRAARQSAGAGFSTTGHGSFR